MTNSEQSKNNVFEANFLRGLSEPVKIESFSDLSAPISYSEQEKIKLEKGRFTVTKMVIIATIIFILLFLIFAFILLIINNCSEGVDPLDRLIKVYLEIIPFWATITGSILGYSFVKKEA